jgi:hypothetical protein
MKIAVYVPRDAALLRGDDTHGWQSVEIAAESLTPGQRLALIDAAKRRASTVVDGADYTLNDVGLTQATDDAVRRYLDSQAARIEREADEERARKEQQKREHEAAVAYALAQGAECLLLDRWRTWSVSTSIDVPGNRRVDIGDDARVAPLIEQAREIARECNAEREAAEEEAERAKEAEEERRVKQLGEAVARLGTMSQRERWAAEVMPRAEAIELIEAETWQPLRDSDLVLLDDSEWHVDGRNPTTSDLRTLTDDEWSVAREIRRLMPDAKISYYIDSAIGEDYSAIGEDYDDCRVWARYAQVRQTVGVLDLCVDVLLSQSSDE